MHFGDDIRSLLCQWWRVREREVCHGGLLKFGLSIWRDGKGIRGRETRNAGWLSRRDVRLGMTRPIGDGREAVDAGSPGCGRSRQHLEGGGGESSLLLGPGPLFSSFVDCFSSLLSHQ